MATLLNLDHQNMQKPLETAAPIGVANESDCHTSATSISSTSTAFTSSSLVNLIGLSFDELKSLLVERGIEAKQAKMRADQIWQWIYVKGVRDFNDMSNISKSLREDFAAQFSLARPEVVEEQISVDGTRKWLLRLSSDMPSVKGPEIETVYIPEKDRGTLCISSQVGCTLTCSFCHTGTQRLVRNLTAGEILAQILLARDRIGDWPNQQKQSDNHLLPEGDRMITNIVLMGMGEPLYNYDNVKKAMHIASDGHGIAISKRRITLSTSGIVPLIHPTGAEIGVNLAISLHAVRDDLRNQLVPINKKYPLAELMQACRTYPTLSNARRITWEYVMLKGVNDSIAEAKELVRMHFARAAWVIHGFDVFTHKGF